MAAEYSSQLSPFLSRAVSIFLSHPHEACQNFPRRHPHLCSSIPINPLQVSASLGHHRLMWLLDQELTQPLFCTMLPSPLFLWAYMATLCGRCICIIGTTVP